MSAHAGGRFITFEGGEGAGKSTHARLLAEGLRAQGIEVVVTREPGGAPGAEQIRRLLVDGAVSRWDPLSEALLHCAARRDHVVTTVRPALAAGHWVISDRFADSTLAYQGYGMGLDREWLGELGRRVVGETVPNLTVMLDLPVEIGLARARERRQPSAEDRYERMDVDFHRRLRDGYLSIARGDPERCAIVDAGAGIDIIRAKIRGVVSERLGVKFP